MRPIQGSGGGGKSGGGGGGREAPNTLRSKATVRFIDVLSEGPIAGLVNGLQSVFVDNTPLQYEDGSSSVEGVMVFGRTGLPDQAHVKGFTSVENEVAVGVQVTKDSPEGSGSGDGSVTRQVTGSNLDAVRIKARLPAGLSQIRGNGDIVGFDVGLAIDVQPSAGVFAEAKADTIDGKTTSPYERAYRVDLPDGGSPWQVRMRRTSDDQTSAKISDDLFWGSYTEIIDAKLIYPDTAYAAVAADAEAYGGRVPVRNYELYGLLVDVPSNYDPQTRQYTGIWNGTFKTEWTDNPAWVLYALLTNKRWGLGDFIEPSQVDTAALYTIAQYCDELVDDGKGGQEPRFTFNHVFEGREEAMRVIALVAGMFRGMVHWGSGAVTVTQDSPADPIRLVTPANVKDGLLQYAGTSLKTRPTVVNVSWRDPDQSYQPATAVVEDLARINQFGYREVDIQALGCTSEGQAIRAGKWVLDEAWNATESLTYQAAFDHVGVVPGNIVSVADPSIQAVGQGLGGRVITPGTSSLVVDRPITTDGVQQFSIGVRMPDGSIEHRNITNAAGDHTTLNLETPLSAAPVPGAVYIVSPVEPRQFRVLTVREVAEPYVEVSAILHDPTKYARIEQGVQLESPPFTALPTGAILAPTSPTHSEYLYKPAAAVLSAVTFSWSAPADPRVTLFEVEFRRPGGSWESAGPPTSTLSVDILNTDDGAWQFRVRSISWGGRSSAWVVYQPTLNALGGLPGDVQNFEIKVIGAIATLTWDPVGDLNLSHYRIKHSPRTDGPTWGEAVDIEPRVTGEIVNVASDVGTYLIKAVTEQGVESANAASITSTIAEVEGLNVVETTTQDPAFTGTKTRTAVVTNQLRLAEQSPDVFYSDGTYLFSNTVDLGAVYTSRVTGRIVASGLNSLNVMSSWASLSSLENLSGTKAEEWSARFQIRTTEDDPGVSPVWSDWRIFVIGDYTARGFQFRVLLSGVSTNISPNITELSATVDMPDRIEAGDDVVVPAAGLRINFTPAFRILSGLGTAAQDLATGDRIAITNKSRTGFDIRVFNSGGTGVQRTVDFVAKGFGKER